MTARRPPDNWPAGALPLALPVDMAAYMVGLSKTTFLQRVSDGLYPKPRRDGKLILWDREKLEAAWRGETAKPKDKFFDPAGQDDALNDFLKRKTG